MTAEQKEQILEALRHGVHDDPELEEILREDLAAIEPLIDRFIREAMEEME
jgi:hypothetical protein